MTLRRLFVLVAVALVVGSLAANPPLTDPDEGLHAAIAQEMVRSGDWITPRFLGEPFLDKPILFFWAEAASLRAFGMNETAVRIPPLFFGVLGMVTVALLGRSLFSEATGLTGGLVYATMLLPLAVSEVAVHDVAVVPFMCAAAWLLYSSASQSIGRSLPGGAAAGVCLGLSVLTKGLVAIAFVGMFAAFVGIARRGAAPQLAAGLAIGVAVAAMVAAPWYIAMERAHPGYLHYYFIERHLQGYLTNTQRHAGRAWWYYLPLVAAGSLPWTGYAMAAASSARRSSPDRRVRWIVWAWFAGGFVFLTIGESKLATYALPLFPALALLTGDSIVSSSGHEQRGPLTLFGSTLAILPIAGLVALQIRFGDSSNAKYWVMSALVSVAVAAGAVLSRPRGHGAATLERRLTAQMSLGALGMLGLILVGARFAAWTTGRDVALQLNRGGQLPPHVLVLEERVGSLVFYLDPALRRDATPERIERAGIAEALRRLPAEPLDAVFVVRNNLLQRFLRVFPIPPVPEATAGTSTMFRAENLRAALQGAR